MNKAVKRTNREGARKFMSGQLIANDMPALGD